MKLSPNRIRIAFFAILFLVVAVVGFVFFFNQLRSGSKAAPAGTAVLSLIAVNNPPMGEDSGVRIGIDLDPNGSATDLYSFDVQMTFDPAKIEFLNPGSAEANVFLQTGMLKQQVTMVNDSIIRIVGTRTTTPFTSSSKRLAEISFKMKSGQAFPATFSWGSTVLQTTNHAKVPLTIASNSSSAGAGASAAAVTTSGPALSLMPSASSYEVGNLVTVEVLLDTQGEQVGSTRISLAYDQAKLTHAATIINTSIFNGTGSAPAPTGGVVTLQASRSNGIVGKVKVATLRFSAKAAGTANLDFNRSQCLALAPGTTSPDLLQSVSPSSVTIVAVGAGASSAAGGFAGGGGWSSGGGEPGEHMESNGDIIHVNGAAFDQAPLRYEQIVKLEKGDYILSASARVYSARGRGVLVALACGESDCGDGKKLNDIFGKTAPFALSSDFQRKETTIHVSDNQKDKKLVVRVFTEDGSEADFDFISLTDVWGGERLTNWHFENLQKVVFQRIYPQFWEMDEAGQVLGTIDRQLGVNGSLFINSVSRPDEQRY